jgi:nitrogen fixation NifU-like protein
MTAQPRDRAAQLEYILDHFQHPRCYGELPQADVVQPGGNPGCGDVITIFLKVEAGSARKGPAVQATAHVRAPHVRAPLVRAPLVRAHYTGSGCTISQAAASILLERVQGLSLAEIEALDSSLLGEDLGQEVLATRPRCATLALDTLKAAVRAYRRIS